MTISPVKSAAFLGFLIFRVSWELINRPGSLLTVLVQNQLLSPTSLVLTGSVLVSTALLYRLFHSFGLGPRFTLMASMGAGALQLPAALVLAQMFPFSGLTVWTALGLFLSASALGIILLWPKKAPALILFGILAARAAGELQGPMNAFTGTIPLGDLTDASALLLGLIIQIHSTSRANVGTKPP